MIGGADEKWEKSLIRSTERVLVTHAGVLPKPPELMKLVLARAQGNAYDPGELARRLRESVAATVRQQAECGIDSVNDGEQGKTTFSHYCRERLGGHTTKSSRPGHEAPTLSIGSRDRRKFPEYFEQGKAGFASANSWPQSYCVGPLTYVGHEALKTDLENFRAALQGVKVAEAYLPANTPGTIEHWLRNEYYKSEEEFVYAIAEAMRDEYKAITDAGFLLQIDDPDLPDGWLMYPDMSVAEYQKYATLRVEALNHALRGIPREKIRLHVCWGSFHGPHHDDIPLKDIADIIFSVPASSYSIEASNPAHEHEWDVFETAKLPEGAVLIPGVVGHCTDFIENPHLVAQRLVRYAKLVGRENVMAGTDCGLGTRVGHGRIAWAKLEAMVEGARLATKELWGRA
jgi:5-methyltetrahydropteroyltriglutamate--homocysteine methyltransferase